MLPPNSEAVKAWLEFLTPVALAVLLVLQWIDRKTNRQTNQMVNGVHGVALQTILTQAQKIAALTGEESKVAQAEHAVRTHQAGTAAVRKGKKS